MGDLDFQVFPRTGRASVQQVVAVYRHPLKVAARLGVDEDVALAGLVVIAGVDPQSAATIASATALDIGRLRKRWLRVD